jgi:hypothetical protein
MKQDLCLFDSNTYFLINFNPKHLEKKMSKLFDKPTDSLNKQKKKNTKIRNKNSFQA